MSRAETGIQSPLRETLDGECMERSPVGSYFRQYNNIVAFLQKILNFIPSRLWLLALPCVHLDQFTINLKKNKPQKQRFANYPCL